MSYYLISYALETIICRKLPSRTHRLGSFELRHLGEFTEAIRKLVLRNLY